MACSNIIWAVPDPLHSLAHLRSQTAGVEHGGSCERIHTARVRDLYALPRAKGICGRQQVPLWLGKGGETAGLGLMWPYTVMIAAALTPEIFL